MRVFYEKRRGIIPALLAKHIDGLEPYAGNQFTCVTSTKVQKYCVIIPALLAKDIDLLESYPGTRFICFTGTEV